MELEKLRVKGEEHIIKMEITITHNLCLICGKKIIHSNKVKAHLIPKCLKPKLNVLVHLHKECEQRINKLYISQQKKPEYERAKKKIMNVLGDLETKIKDIENKINE